MAWGTSIWRKARRRRPRAINGRDRSPEKRVRLMEWGGPWGWERISFAAKGFPRLEGGRGSVCNPVGPARARRHLRRAGQRHGCSPAGARGGAVSRDDQPAQVPEAAIGGKRPSGAKRCAPGCSGLWPAGPAGPKAGPGIPQWAWPGGTGKLRPSAGSGCAKGRAKQKGELRRAGPHPALFLPQFPGGG